jgi:hypothetical protein
VVVEFRTGFRHAGCCSFPAPVQWFSARFTVKTDICSEEFGWLASLSGLLCRPGKRSCRPPHRGVDSGFAPPGPTAHRSCEACEACEEASSRRPPPSTPRASAALPAGRLPDLTPPPLKGVQCGLDPTRSLAKLPGKQCGPNPTLSHSPAPDLTPPPLTGVRCGSNPTRSLAIKPGKQCGPNPSLSQSPAPAPDLTPSGAYILPGRFRSPVYGKAKLLPPSLRVALARPGARWAALKGRSGWVGSAAASRTRKNPPPPDEVWTWTVPQARCVCVFDTPTLQRTHRLPVSACRKPSPLHGDL